MKFHLTIFVAVALAQDAEVGSRAIGLVTAAAEAALHKALAYEPDLDPARRMLAELGR